ncbi:Rpn family recombination-promoting nuclease/putative transposase [Duganella sp. HH105]|uniref:Rpn family recombination-promoting nuclease/putative transposase n=1 Tax=Duganella sp. HH105 TaxID=1781067 RepID=UPI000877E826|nr:Rpn family recombination-promoting nuclease/putative transposase [Duganella sp. HH105]OEZ57674.1 putative transposase [Duganella sp. HH105]
MNIRSDTLYRQLFAHPEIVRDLLAGFLPAGWARSLEVGAFERVNASYASDRGKQRHQDMVWRAKVGGEWVYVYILLEFQARSDRWMALRMQVYVGLLLQDLVRKRLADPDFSRARESLMRWVQSTLHDEFDGTSMTAGANFEEGATMLFDKRFNTVEELWDYEEKELIRKKKAEITEKFGIPTDQDTQTVLEAEIKKARYGGMRDALYAGRDKGYADGLKHGRIEGRAEGHADGLAEGWDEGWEEGREEDRKAWIEALYGLLAKSDAVLPVEANKKIAIANARQLSEWVTRLVAGADPNGLFS